MLPFSMCGSRQIVAFSSRALSNKDIYTHMRREGTKASFGAKGGALRVRLAFPSVAAFFRFRSKMC